VWLVNLQLDTDSINKFQRNQKQHQRLENEIVAREVQNQLFPKRFPVGSWACSWSRSARRRAWSGGD